MRKEFTRGYWDGLMISGDALGVNLLRLPMFNEQASIHDCISFGKKRTF